MYAVVKTGGKQYRVAEDDIIKIERLEGEEGDIIALGEVLMIGDGADIKVGAPFIEGASVAGEIVEQGRGPKIIVFKKRRRQNYRRKKGHRQLLTTFKVTAILTDGAKPSAKKAAKKATKSEEKAPETKAAKPKAAKAAAPEADFIDDVSLIGGVGPKLKEKLESHGITSLKQLAKMSEADVAKLDEALELHGRATRDEWVSQAKELVAGKPPRAKTDRAKTEE